jgi:hypothetical protein
MKDKIPEVFYKGDANNDGFKPIAYTVKDLKEILLLLPDDLKIERGFSEGAQLIVFNIDTDPHLDFEEADY